MLTAARNKFLALHVYLSGHGTLLNIIKYTILFFLAITSSIYIAADVAAARQTLEHTSTWFDWLSTYAISVDVVGWLGLLVVYELETSVLDDEWLNRGWKWLFYALAGLLYLCVFNALMGYLGKFWMISHYEVLSAAEFCTMQGWTFMQALDEFTVIGQNNCTMLNQLAASGNMFKIDGHDIVFNIDEYYGLGGAWSIALSDAVEAVLWIVAMGLIQLEIVLQLRGALGPAFTRITARIKFVVYLLIVLVTSYYSLFGRTVDMYDSILWLLAFLFIELNLSQWTQETLADQVQVEASFPPVEK